MVQRLNLTRDQLASFLQDHEQIKQFELLFSSTNANSVLIDEVSISAGNASASANEALSQTEAISQILEQIALSPRSELGTMSELQQANVPWLQFSTQPSGYPTGPDANGTVYWDDADAIKTLNIVMEDSGEVIQHVGEETYYRVKASSTITKGQVVMLTGTVGASGGLIGAPATGLTVFQSERVLGIATQNIATNGWGYVTWFGEVKKINTTGGAEAWVDGDVLYYNPAVTGGLTKIVPVAPNPKVIVAAVVHASINGILFVRPSFGSVLGATDSNVDISGLANNDMLLYDGVQLRWENKAPSAIRTALGLGTMALKNIGVSGTFITADTPAKTVTVTDGIITNIV